MDSLSLDRINPISRLINKLVIFYFWLLPKFSDCPKIVLLLNMPSQVKRFIHYCVNFSIQELTLILPKVVQTKQHRLHTYTYFVCV